MSSRGLWLRRFSRIIMQKVIIKLMMNLKNSVIQIKGNKRRSGGMRWRWRKNIIKREREIQGKGIEGSLDGQESEE